MWDFSEITHPSSGNSNNNCDKSIHGFNCSLRHWCKEDPLKVEIYSC